MPLISLDGSCLITYESCPTLSRAIKVAESQPYTHLYMQTLLHVNANTQANTHLLSSHWQQPTAAHSFSVSSKFSHACSPFTAYACTCAYKYVHVYVCACYLRTVCLKQRYNHILHLWVSLKHKNTDFIYTRALRGQAGFVIYSPFVTKLSVCWNLFGCFILRGLDLYLWTYTYIRSHVNFCIIWY